MTLDPVCTLSTRNEGLSSCCPARGALGVDGLPAGGHCGRPHAGAVSALRRDTGDDARLRLVRGRRLPGPPRGAAPLGRPRDGLLRRLRRDRDDLTAVALVLTVCYQDLFVGSLDAVVADQLLSVVRPGDAGVGFALVVLSGVGGAVGSVFVLASLVLDSVVLSWSTGSLPTRSCNCAAVRRPRAVHSIDDRGLPRSVARPAARGGSYRLERCRSGSSMTAARLTAG